MESAEIDSKPTFSTDNAPDGESLLTVSLGVNKLKQSRYEDVWPEDVHAAFMEAVALYPPMGKRRLKYYRVSTHENEHFCDANRAKSFGRCQLIQSYILEKTGKNRSRKQVSSHLQRLKKIHKDNPTMRPLFSERSQLPSEHRTVSQAAAISSQDILTNISFSTRPVMKGDFDPAVNVQNADTNVDNSLAFSYTSESPLVNGGPCDAPDLTDMRSQPAAFFSQEFSSPQRSPAVSWSPSDDYLSELPDPLLFKNAINGGFRASSTFNTSGFSISMRRLASRFPLESRPDSYPTHFSRALHSSTFQPARQWISQDGVTDDSPPIPTQQLFHGPFHPPLIFAAEKQTFDSGFASSWMWPQDSTMDFGPREGTFDEIPTIYQPSSVCSEMRMNSPEFYNSPSGSEQSQLSQGISYPYLITSPSTGMPESVSTESGIGFPGQPIQASSEGLASPPMIKPTPIYPVSYVPSDGAHTPTLEYPVTL